jgi:Tfp pilus assembly protein FimT
MALLLLRLCCLARFWRASEVEKLIGLNNGVAGSMHKEMNFPERQAKLSSAAGVSVVELLVVTMIVAGLSTFALISFQRSSRSFKLSGAARNLSAYLEKARVNSMRRHGGANVVINSTTSYTANIDFSGTGTLYPRTISLPPGTSISYTLPPATTSIDPSTTPITITYDWRGRTNSTVLLTLTDSIGGVAPSTVVVGRAGNLTTDTTFTGPVTTPTPQDTTVTTTTGIKSMQY